MLAELSALFELNFPDGPQLEHSSELVLTASCVLGRQLSPVLFSVSTNTPGSSSEPKDSELVVEFSVLYALSHPMM